MTPEELETLLRDLKAEMFNLRFRNSLKQLDNPLRIREVRRAIARIQTLLNEHRKGIRRLGESAIK
jgi:large subunit ribosomal protein L29